MTDLIMASITTSTMIMSTMITITTMTTVHTMMTAHTMTAVPAITAVPVIIPDIIKGEKHKAPLRPSGVLSAYREKFFLSGLGTEGEQL